MTMGTTGTMTTVLDPTAAPTPVSARLAPRADSLNGLRLGLLDNHKRNATAVLDEIEKLISQRYELASVVRRHKADVSRPCPGETVADLAAQADIVITAIGD